MGCSVTADIPRETIEKCFFIGTPEKVAADLQAYVDVGVTWSMMADVMPVVVDFEQAVDAGRRADEVCAIREGKDPATVSNTVGGTTAGV